VRGIQFRLRPIVALLVFAPVAATAQHRPRIEVVLPPHAVLAVEGPQIRSERLLMDPRVGDLLRNGFPARVHYKLERWGARRGFDHLRATYEWDVVVRYDPLRDTYRVIRARGREVAIVGNYPALTAADSAVGAPLLVSITLPRIGERTYYALRVDLEMVSVSDLDEVEQWLRGELRPAVRGERNPGTALERGSRTLLVRLLGGEKRRYLVRSEIFRP
jgi:hypothetical protein